MNLEVIDKDRVRQSFSRQAPVYEDNAPLQKDVAERLISSISLTPQVSRLKVLDIGIGTGFATREFRSRFPDAEIFGCDIARGMLKEAEKTGAVLAEADAERLPYKDKTFDLAFSSLALQWTNISNSLCEANRILKPGGRFYFSTFGTRTLAELSDSHISAWRSMGMEGTPRTMNFESAQDIRNLMESNGFREVNIQTELINSNYESPEGLLKSLKVIGAGNPSREFHPSRRLLNETFMIYKERYGDDDGISASFEVIYIRGTRT